MAAELHIIVHPDIDDVEDIIERFPYEPGQSLLASSINLLVIDLAGADDTTYVQDWFLNAHDGVSSFYIVDDEAPAEPSQGSDD